MSGAALSRFDSRSFVAESTELAHARRLQYPVASHVRSMQIASNASDLYVAALETAEMLAMVLGMNAAAWLNHTGEPSIALARLGDAYPKGVAFGVWLDVARRAASGAGHDQRVPQGVVALTDKTVKEQVKQLDTLIQERNRSAHGRRPRSEAEAERRLSEILPPLATALDGAALLEHVPWIVTTSSSYRARERTWDVVGRRVMADHPAFETYRWNVRTPVADHRVYIVPSGFEPIDLTPFVALRHCETCLNEELFHSARLPRSGGTELKSFTSSHAVTDASLDDEIGALTQKRPT